VIGRHGRDPSAEGRRRRLAAAIALGVAVLATAIAGADGASAGRAADAPTSGTYNGRVTYTDTTDASRTPPPSDSSVRASCSGSTCQIQSFVLRATGPNTYHLDTTRPNQSNGKPCPDSPIHLDATFSGTKLHYVVRFDQVGQVSICRVDGLIQDYSLTLDPKSVVTTTTTTATTTTAVATTAAPGRPTGAAKPATGPAGPPAALTAKQRSSWRAARAGRRTTVSAALQSPADAVKGGGGHLAGNVLLAGLLVLLLVFPSQLFNSTYDKHHARVEAGLLRVLPWRRRAVDVDAVTADAGPGGGLEAGVVDPPPDGAAAVTEPVGRPASSRTATYGSGVVVGALLAELLDPNVSLSAAAVALFLAVIASTLFGATVGLLVGRGYRGSRHLSGEALLDAVPSGLVVAAMCVLVSRLTHFQPGYLYGLLGGFAFTVAMAEKDDGREEMAAIVVTLLVALVAWIAFIPVSTAANKLDPNFMVQLADALLAALFIGGIEGLLFGLIPLRFLPGHRLARWSWVAWTAAASVVTMIFVTVLLRPSSGYLGSSTTASVTVTYVLFGLFGAGSIAFWAWFRFRPDPAEPDEAATPAGPVDLGDPPLSIDSA
jgi:hypothetical protein